MLTLRRPPRSPSPLLRLALSSVVTAALVACSDGGTEATYCERLTSYQTTASDVGTVFTDRSSTAEEIERTIDGLLDTVDDLRAAAPSEITGDIDTVRDAFGQLADLLANYDHDYAALLASPDASALAEVFTGDDVLAASDRLDRYGREACGLDEQP